MNFGICYKRNVTQNFQTEKLGVIIGIENDEYVSSYNWADKNWSVGFLMQVRHVLERFYSNSSLMFMV